MPTKPAKTKPAVPASPWAAFKDEALKPKPAQIIYALHSEVSDHPELAILPTLDQSAVLGEAQDDDGPSAVWGAFQSSVQEHGQIEPGKAVRRPDGKGWWVVDGRSRRAASAAAGRTHYPLIEVPASAAMMIVMQTLIRRQLPAGARGYLVCLLAEDQLTGRRHGGDRKSDQFSERNLIGAVTQKSAAQSAGVRVEVINQCVAALKHFQSHPEDRKTDEPLILAGLKNPNTVLPGIKGREEKGKPRRPSSYDSWYATAGSWTSQVREYFQWSATHKASTEALLKEEAAKWPVEFRRAIAAAVQAAGDQPSAEEIKAGQKAAAASNTKGARP